PMRRPCSVLPRGASWSSWALLLAENAADMFRDDHFFVGPDDADRRRRAGRRDDVRARGVALRVDPDAEEVQPLADFRPDLRRVLPDAAGEDERVEPAEHRRERPDPLAGLPAVERDSLGGAFVFAAAVEELAHVGTRAR